MSRVSTVKDGDRFGRWTVIKSHVGWMALCKCDCGTIRRVKHHSIATGNSHSCGCWKLERNAERRKNRWRGTPEYTAWINMKTRCHNPRFIGSKYYLKKGITICARWDSYVNFIQDMGNRPSRSHSLERKNNNLGYSKNNCKWATRHEQNVNKSSNRYVTRNGVKKTVSEWCDALNLKRLTVYNRIYRGFPPSTWFSKTKVFR